MAITFGLLGFAICSVWFNSFQVRDSILVPPWLLLFGAAVVAGVITGYLNWAAVVGLGSFCSVAYMAARKNASKLQRVLFSMLSAILALALAMHKLPGFNNPVFISNEKFTPDAAPFTLFANFDKSAAGLILLALFCKRAQSLSEWYGDVSKTCPILLATSVVVIGIAIAIGYTKPEFKLPLATPMFLAMNLLFTCVAEECFFRGFLQDRLANSIADVRFAIPISVAASALLFGAVHFAGGLAFVALATLSGLGAALAYAVVGRIEAPIMVHFVFNAIHFVGFTYPRLL